MFGRRRATSACPSLRMFCTDLPITRISSSLACTWTLEVVFSLWRRYRNRMDSYRVSAVDVPESPIANICGSIIIFLSLLVLTNACRIITGVDEVKWVRGVWRNAGMTFVAGEMGETTRKTYPDSCSSNKKPTFSARDSNAGPQRAVGGTRLFVCAIEPLPSL